LHDDAMITTGTHSIYIVPFVTAAKLFAIFSFRAHPKIDQKPREISSDSGSQSIWLGHQI
jgi:hypothetical protein